MKNFFETFLLPTNFLVDLAALEKKYLEFQNAFHPDKSGSDDISQAIEINEAYKILSDDFLRACHLLALKGVDIQNDEKAIKVDISTLQAMLELQEKISEISDKSEIENLRQEISSEVSVAISQFTKLYEDSEIALAAQVLVKAKYLKKAAADLKIRKQKI